MKMSGKVATLRSVRERPARPQPPRKMPKVGDRITQRCGHTGFLFEYEITHVFSPTRYSMKMVGMAEEQTNDA